MTRDIGGIASADPLPEVAVAAGGLLTQLGDAWFLLLATAALYWRARDERAPALTATPLRDCLLLLALLVGSYAATAALKTVFALPRPPGAGTAVLPSWLPPAVSPVYDSLVTADGYGFPSGHATTATAVYGGAAAVLSAGARRPRYIAAGSIAVLVAISRLVIGVHYLIDVVAGVLLGLGVLAALLGLVGRFGSAACSPDPSDPRCVDTRSAAPALAGAALLAVTALALAPGLKPLLGLLGATLGLVLCFARDRSASSSLGV